MDLILDNIKPSLLEDLLNDDPIDLSILESVLDPINKTRCKEIFDSNDNMKSDVKKFILDIVNGFKQKVDFTIRNVYMIGSSTGYQYTNTSDIDIEVETDLPKEKLWNIIKLIPKGTLLPNTQKPINLFVLDKDTSYDFKNAENVYDVVSGKWLKDSGKESVEIPYPYIKGLATYFMNGCDLAISEFNKDMKEIQEYMDLDPETQEISQKEKVEALDRKIVDLRKDIDSLKMAHHVIFGFEKEGYEGMPFKISIDSELNNREERYSVNNLVYKYVDKFGYLDKMNELMRTGKDKIKEVEKYLKTLQPEDKEQLKEDIFDSLIKSSTSVENNEIEASIFESILSDTDDCLLEDAKGNKISSFRWRLILGCLKYVSAETFYDMFPNEEPNLNRSERTKKLKAALNNLSLEKKREILNLHKAKELEAKAEKIGNKHKIAGRTVGIASSVAGGVVGIGVGIGTGAKAFDTVVGNAEGIGKIFAAIVGPIVALIIGILAACLPMIIGGTISIISNTIGTSNARKARHKYAFEESEEGITELLKQDIEANGGSIEDAIISEPSKKPELDLTEDISKLFDELNPKDPFLDMEINKIFGTSDFRYKIDDVLKELYPIVYGFISVKDGSRIDDRDYIHNCNCLNDIYRVNYDPTVTLKNKLGICTDQSIATDYLINKYHPDIKCQLYALMKGRFGHCVCTLNDNGNYYYLENAWDKKRGLHGPFASEGELEKYLFNTYFEAHKDDNDDEVIVRKYEDYLKENLSESLKK